MKPCGTRLVFACQAPGCDTTHELLLEAQEAIQPRGSEPVAYTLRPQWAMTSWERDNADTPSANDSRGGPPVGFSIEHVPGEDATQPPRYIWICAGCRRKLARVREEAAKAVLG